MTDRERIEKEKLNTEIETYASMPKEQLLKVMQEESLAATNASFKMHAASGYLQYKFGMKGPDIYRAVVEDLEKGLATPGEVPYDGKVH